MWTKDEKVFNEIVNGLSNVVAEHFLNQKVIVEINYYPYVKHKFYHFLLF